MPTKYGVYRSLSEECIKRGLTFEHIGKEIAGGSSLGFLIHGNVDGTFSQGVVCESVRRKDLHHVWHGLKKNYFGFFDFTEEDDTPGQRQNSVVFVDAMLGHFFCIPYEVLKGDLRDKKHALYPQKQFEIVIEGGAYRLKNSRCLINKYMDTLEPLFEVFSTPAVVSS